MEDALHVCQPSRAAGDQDPDFPDLYRRNPWCWSEDLGFHRTKKPAERRELQLSKGSRLVSANKIDAGQAVRLGAGIGISNMGGPRDEIGECLARVVEVTEHSHYIGDAGMWARYGAAACDNNIDRSLEDIQEVVRIMTRTLIVSNPEFPGREVYRRLIEGRATTADKKLLSSDTYASTMVRVLVEGHTYGGVTRQIYRLYLEHGKATTEITNSMVEALITSLNAR